MKIRWKGRRKREGDRQAEREGSAGMTRKTTRWSRGPHLVPLLKGTPRSGLQRGPPKPERQVETMESQTWSLCFETWESSCEAHMSRGPDAKTTQMVKECPAALGTDIPLSICMISAGNPQHLREFFDQPDRNDAMIQNDKDPFTLTTPEAPLITT